ncbi:MAG: hypothetical protein VB119_12245 [Candidatus Metalachnospira sp.]|nr:hypothetical protein [Candidatus Metalachnospira sp.]
MKKIRILAILTVMITLLFSVNTFAAEYNGEPDAIVITGGIDMDKDYESTFNDSRTVTGMAQCGTQIVIMLCSKDDAGVLIPETTYEATVGISGYFSQNVKLNIGENIIIVYSADENASITATIKRKSDDIKDKLENGVYIPWGNSCISNSIN